MPFPVIEVHLSNLAKREEWRHRSIISPAVHATVQGLGWRSYTTAFTALVEMLRETARYALLAERRRSRRLIFCGTSMWRQQMKLVRAFLGGMLAALVTTAYAQQGPVLIYGIMELSGTGATPGTNFDNGVKLAVKEINAAGGILGRKINYVSTDTQTNPTVAK